MSARYKKQRPTVVWVLLIDYLCTSRNEKSMPSPNAFNRGTAIGGGGENKIKT